MIFLEDNRFKSVVLVTDLFDLHEVITSKITSIDENLFIYCCFLNASAFCLYFSDSDLLSKLK